MLKRNKFISFLLMLLIVFSISGCKPNDKEQVLYTDVNKHNNSSNKDLLNIYQEAEDDLNSGNYDDAKKIFCKVLDMTSDKSICFLI